jgi:DNA-binding NtrC family response regulator
VREKLDALAIEMFDRGIRLEDALHELERRFISRALQTCDGSIGEAAGRLGIHRNTLSRKMEEYKLRLRKHA